MIHLAYITAVHGRHEVVRHALRHAAALRDSVKEVCRLSLPAAISPCDEALIPDLEAAGFTWIMAANEPVSAKHQAALNAARSNWPDLDAVMQAGSDDFISEGYVRFAARRVSRHMPSFGVGGFYMLDAETGRLAWWDKPLYLPTLMPTPYGIGRVFMRGLLDSVDWQVWPFQRNAGLDAAAARHLEGRGFHLTVIDPSAIDGGAAVLIDVKTAENIHPFSEFTAGANARRLKYIPSARADELCRLAGLERSWFCRQPADDETPAPVVIAMPRSGNCPPVTVVTAWSSRSRDMGAVLENHLALADVQRFVWLANGLTGGEWSLLRSAARRCSVPVTLLRSKVCLPIARAYNQCLAAAHEDGPTDVLELQDDVMAPEGLVASLQNSPLDLPAAWHVDRQRRDYDVEGYRYVVSMAMLIRKGLFKTLGYFDELFIRGVDAEYGVRASARGLSVGFIDAPSVRHIGHQTTGGDNASVRMIHQQALALLRYFIATGRILQRREMEVSTANPVQIDREFFSGAVQVQEAVA